MPFEKGNSISKGRPHNAPNKGSKSFKEAMDKIGMDIAMELNERYIQALTDDRNDLAIKVLIEMASYVYPKLKAIEHTTARDVDTLSKEEKIKALITMLKELGVDVK